MTPLLPDTGPLEAIVLADATSIGFVYHLCAFLPAIGLLAMFLPSAKKLAEAQAAG